ncbi:MAG: (d)CMP kinase [Desulfobacterales bacterium]|nr:(d)CMP kinase [Desulfobacterales bacterium]
MEKLLITIDGPAGAGKTTVSRIVAKKLGYKYVDTGALYRGVAYEAISNGLKPNDDAGLEALFKRINLEFVDSGNGSRLYSNGKDINDFIRTPEITMFASAVSARSIVRSGLLGLQQDIGSKKEAVFEGRDMGTVVFPDADVKFFLDASPHTRAIRRFNEMPEGTQTLKEVEADIVKRDKNDSSRVLAPLKPAIDAIIIDSGKLDIDGVVSFMLKCIDDAG